MGYGAMGWERGRLEAALEALLFVADAPPQVGELARALDTSPAQVEEALAALARSLQGRGLRLQRQGDRVRLVTAPELAPYVERFLGLRHGHRLSRAALETLAIIAYRQPITRGQIEAIRGASCERALATLKARGLVQEVGRAPLPGRPRLYGTTLKFLEHFGLERPEDLPPLTSLSPRDNMAHGAPKGPEVTG